ncbi:MAG TPA: O-antigen ligase family protein [Novosphingobium sp.]|nr:O-antigen ligase family protein [Novosphingobium sp.]
MWGLTAAITIAAVPAVTALLTWRAWSLTLFYLTPITFAELLVVLLAIAAGFDLKATLQELSKPVAAAALIWAGVVIAAALSATGDPPQAVIRGGQSLAHGLFFLVLSRMFSYQWFELRRQFLIAIAIGAVLFLPVIVSAVYAARLTVPFTWNAVATGVTNIRQIGFYGVALAGCAIGLLATEGSKPLRWLYGLALVAGMYLCFWSGGRGASLPVLIVLVLVGCFTSGAARKRVALWSLTAIAVAAPMSEGLKPWNEFGIVRILNRATATEVEGTDYSSGRIEIWISTLERVPEHPFIGHGEGQFRSEIPALQRMFNHPHNVVIQFLYQWGVIGTFAVVVMILPAICRSRMRATDDPGVGLPAIAAMLGFLGMGLVEGPFFHPYPVMPVLICLAALASPTVPRLAIRHSAEA